MELLDIGKAQLFWQIDQSKKIHTGKIILFDEHSGKRIKIPFPHIHWVHNKINNGKYNLKQCLFGLHQLKSSITIPLQRNLKTIAIVESEKTAIIMSLFVPEYFWMATGSKHNLKLELVGPIKNENIVVYPDKGEFADWNKKVIGLKKLGFQIECSVLVENSKFETGADLADIYFYLKKDQNKVEIQLSEMEKKIRQLSKINPSIISLVKVFDLIDEKGNGIRIL